MALTKITSTNIGANAVTSSAIGYTPANKAGDTFTGELTLNHADEVGLKFKATGTDGTTASKILFEDTAGGVGGILRFDHDDNSFKFATAGDTERMRIDSSGRVTKPYQPVFSARITAVTDMTSSSDFVFNAVDINIGNHYSNSTGRFTAPVTGSYFFHWEGLATNTEDDTVDVRFYRNGSQTQLATNYMETDLSGGYRKGWMTAIASLSAGDYIAVRSQSGSTATFYGDNNGLISVSGSGHTQFKGYLIG